jgi:hypothetical protein
MSIGLQGDFATHRVERWRKVRHWPTFSPFIGPDASPG